MTTIALLGTGLLGHAIGQRLLEQGQTLKVWNRTPARISALIRAGATPIERLSEISTGCDAVITVLKDGPVTSDVVQALGDLQGRCLIPMGTMGITESRTLATVMKSRGGTYLEAPVLGSRPEALSGSLLVMAGGEPEVFNRHQDLLGLLSAQPMLVGAVGSGAATKLALNQLIASMTHAFSISLRLVQQAEVPVETFMNILRPSALYAPTYDKKLKRMLERHYSDPNFSTALLRKDLALFLQEAIHAGLNPDGLRGLSTLLAQDKARDLDDLDYCSLHELTAQDES